MKKRKSKRKLKGFHVTLIVFLVLVCALGAYSIAVKEKPQQAIMSLLAAFNTQGPDQSGMIEEYEAAIRELEADRHSLRQTISQREAEIQAANNRLSEAERTLAQQQGQSAAWAAERDRLTRRVADLEQQLATVRSLLQN